MTIANFAKAGAVGKRLFQTYPVKCFFKGKPEFYLRLKLIKYSNGRLVPVINFNRKNQHYGWNAFIPAMHFWDFFNEVRNMNGGTLPEPKNPNYRKLTFFDGRKPSAEAKQPE